MQVSHPPCVSLPDLGAKPGPQGQVLVPALGYLKVFATAHTTSGHPTVQGGLHPPMNNLRPWTSLQLMSLLLPFIPASP